jgi:cellulose biosynthesis protein BcsQ
MNKEYMNHRQAAIELQINEKTLTRIITEKQIPYSKKGREKLYLKSDIDTLKGIEMPDTVEQKIITVHSGKGGTGKTTICNYLSKMLANNGYKVLVIDADPQHYYTRFWGTQLNEEEQNRIKTHNLLSLLEGEKKLIKCALPINENLHFIAGNRKLEHYDSLFANSYGRELKMQKALEPALSKYDYIIIDTSPSQGGVTVAALFACHMLICPIDPEVDSLDSAIELAKSVDTINKSEMNTHFNLTKLYILPIKQKEGFFGNTFQKEVLKEINTVFEGRKFSIDIEVLKPILDDKSIPVERWQGIFKENTKAFNNHHESLKEVYTNG